MNIFHFFVRFYQMNPIRPNGNHHPGYGLHFVVQVVGIVVKVVVQMVEIVVHFVVQVVEIVVQ